MKMHPIAIDASGRPVPPAERWIRQTESSWPGSTGWVAGQDGVYRNARLEAVMAKRPPTPFELKTGQYAFALDKAVSVEGEQALVTKHKITTGMKAAMIVAGGALMWRLFGRREEPLRQAPDMDALIGRLPSSDTPRSIRSARERAEYDVARAYAERQYPPVVDAEYEDQGEEQEEAWL